MLHGLCLAAAVLGPACAASAQAPAVPPPVEQQTADCRSPVFATDQLVCGDPALRALDSELAAQLAAAPAPTSRWIEPHWQWFLRRSRCAFVEDHAACAAAAYLERLAVLRPMASDAALQAVRCDDPDVMAISVSPERITLYGRQDRVLGVVQEVSDEDKWQPFLSISRRDGNLMMRSVQGDSLRCRPRSKRDLQQ